MHNHWKQAPTWQSRSRPRKQHPVQRRDLLGGYRRSLGTGVKPWEGGTFTQRAFCLLLNTVWPFPGVRCSVWERFAIWKGGFCFLFSPTNLTLLWSQGSFLVPHKKDTFRITASFSECVSYVNAASQKFPSALHFNSAFKTCKTETQRKTPWKYSGFHLFSIFYVRLPRLFVCF